MDYDILSEIREALASADADAVRARIEGLWPADLADVVERLDPDERQGILALLSDEAAGMLLHVLDEVAAADVVAGLPPERASRILGESPSDDAADVLQDLPDEAADALLAGMDAEDARAVRELLEYPETTAGGRMITQFARVSETARVSEVMAGLRADPPAAETAYYLYACDDAGHPLGVVSLRDLVVAASDARVGEIMARDVITIRADADQEDAADLVARYDLLALPVVDAAGRMLGVVTVDDILEVLEEEATEDILGVPSDDEAPPERATLPLPARARGLVSAALGGLAAAAVLAFLLAGGPARTHSLLFIPLALAVSEVVTGQVMGAVAGALRRDWRSGGLARAVGRELGVTASVAAAGGLVVALALGHWRGLARVGVALGASVLLVAVVAAAAGAAIPLLAHARRRDPSTASLLAATALADVLGLAAYLWVMRNP